MAYYSDLSPCPYFGKAEADQLVAIGWLDEAHPYTQGQTSEEFVDKLLSLLVEPWAPMSLLGFADCPFCTGPDEVAYKGTTIQVGASNVFVPGEGFLYVAPSLIAHYILSHNYIPPMQFCEAVLQCPPMRTKDYFKAIVANAPQRYADSVKKRNLSEV